MTSAFVLSLSARSKTQTDLVSDLSSEITSVGLQTQDYQSQLLKYQIEKDKALSKAADKAQSESTLPSGQIVGSGEWDMGGQPGSGMGGFGPKSGKGKK